MLPTLAFLGKTLLDRSFNERRECVLNAQVASGDRERAKIPKKGDCRSTVLEMQEQMNPS